jgi:1-acyl-sn-glycerol-3-phosphate acyltransferase
MFEQVKRIVLEEQLPILVFPEGTRDGTTALKAFKKGMFDFAVQHRCHVLVMVIDGPQRCWPFPGPWFESGEMQVAFGPLLPPTDDAETLMASTRSAMQALLDDIGASAAPAPSQGQKGAAVASDSSAGGSGGIPSPSGTATTIPSTSATR